MIFQSFFGFGQSADIDIVLDGAETRKQAEVKTEDGKKEKLLLYYDGETVSGKVYDFFVVNIRNKFNFKGSFLTKLIDFFFTKFHSKYLID